MLKTNATQQEHTPNQIWRPVIRRDKHSIATGLGGFGLGRCLYVCLGNLGCMCYKYKQTCESNVSGNASTPSDVFPGSDHMSCTRAIALHDFDPTEYKELLQATLLLAAKHFEAKISAGLVASITTATADLQLPSMMARSRRCCTMAHQLQTQR